MAESKLSKTARRSMMNEGKTIAPKVIAWAWERGVKVGVGRKPDAYIFTEDQFKMFNSSDFILIRANSQWVGSAPTPGVRR